MQSVYYIVQDMEVVVYPDKIADAGMERLLSVLFNSDVMIYIADADNLNSTDKVYLVRSLCLRLTEYELH